VTTMASRHSGSNFISGCPMINSTDRLTTIGIPGRFSLLHVAGIVQCIEAGLLTLAEYHPAKLFYRGNAVKIFLFHEKQLCVMLNSGLLDLIFVGDEYAQEWVDFPAHSLCFPTFQTQLALLSGAPPTCPAESEVYTRFPQTASKYLELWGVRFSSLVTVYGAGEAYCLALPDGFAFDVVCTGVTKATNDLHILESTRSLSSSWYYRDLAVMDRIGSVTEDRGLLSAVRTYYEDLLTGRDHVMYEGVRHIVVER
jgi:ATP phosphoribosyltransferase